MTNTITVLTDAANPLDTEDQAESLVNQGSVATPSRVVPAGMSRITTLIAAVATDLANADHAVFLLRLTGDAIKEGQQTLIIAAGGGALVQAGADPDGLHCPPIILENLDIEVKAGSTITVQAEMAGGDLGDAHMSVTLIFA